MEKSFYRSAKLSPQQLGQLIKKNDATSLQHFILMYSIFIGSAVVLVLTWNQVWWLAIPALLLFASSVPALFACEHECIHQTAFKTRSLNYWVALLAGISYGYAPTLFKDFHFAHHQYTHQPGWDPEISIGRKPMPSIVDQLPTYLAWLMGLPLLLFRIYMMLMGALGTPEIVRKNLLPFIQPKHRWPIFLESWLILGLHGSIVYLAMNGYPSLWGLVIGQLLGTMLWAAYTAPEHNGLPHEGHILEKTRSIKSGSFLRWWMWNMTYHAEHHAYPAVPHHALPHLHQCIQEEIIHKETSHLSFNQQVLYDTTIGKLQ